MLLWAAFWSVAHTGAAANFSQWTARQQIEVPAAGLVKLKLAVDTLNAALPDLRDLRVLDATTNEVPCAIERPFPSAGTTRKAKEFLASLALDSTTLFIETGLTQTLAGLTLQTPARNFLKAVRIESSADRQRWQVLAERTPIFRQPSGASQLYLALPSQVSPHLRLTVDDRRSAPVPFTGVTLHLAEAETFITEPASVQIVERLESADETRLTLRFEGAHARLASIAIETPAPLFMRRVTLATREWDGETVRETSLASGTIYRVAVEGQPPSARLSLPIERQSPTRELLLLIHNGDNPPLEITSVSATRRPDYLIFFARTAELHTILLGNPRALAPRYDLASLNVDLKRLPVSSTVFSPVTANPDFKSPEVLPEIPMLGSALDPSSWPFRKQVQVSGSGIQQIELDLDILARAQPSLADLRLVSDGKQVPFILERTSMTRSLFLSTTNANDPKRPTVSRWSLKLPRSGLPITRLSCEPQTALFDRNLYLYEEAPDNRGQNYRRSLGSATWTQAPDRRAKQLTLVLNTAPQTDTLILETENGDNQPIDLANFRAFHPVSRLLFKAPLDAPVHLYYGHRNAIQPRYDLDLVASQMLRADKSVPVLAAEELVGKMPRQSRWLGGRSGVLFWAVLALVVVGLLVIISRLVPKSPAPPA